MIQIAIQLFFLFCLLYIGTITVYFFVISLSSKFYKTPEYSPNPVKVSIAVLITAYKEDEVIVTTVKKAIGHNYPTELFDIYVAADSLKPETLHELNELQAKIIEVHFTTGSKARSLNHLLNIIPVDRYTLALILDADNVMMPGMLEKINDAYQKGFRAIQVHRIAKNNNNAIAMLDAITEEINNTLFRKAQRSLGFSANTIGSGMAFEMEKLKEIYSKEEILSNPACDREVDFEMMKANICIEYISDAYVLDEKVSARQVFERQRTRWLESQLTHLKLFLSQSKLIKKKDKDYWNKLFTNLLPPRSFILLMYLFAVGIFLVEHFTGYTMLIPSFYWWLSFFILFLITFFIAIPIEMYSLKSLKSLTLLPALLLSMVKAVLSMKNKRKEFVHTPKSFVEEQASSRD